MIDEEMKALSADEFARMFMEEFSEIVAENGLKDSREWADKVLAELHTIMEPEAAQARVTALAPLIDTFYRTHANVAEEAVHELTEE